MGKNTKVFLVARGLEEMRVPTPRIARDVLAAAVRPDSVLVDGMVNGFLRLPRELGGYGWIAIGDADRAALRAEIIRQGGALLDALDR